MHHGAYYHEAGGATLRTVHLAIVIFGDLFFESLHGGGLVG